MTQLITIKMVLRRSLKKARALQEIAAYGVSVGYCVDTAQRQPRSYGETREPGVSALQVPQGCGGGG